MYPKITESKVKFVILIKKNRNILVYFVHNKSQSLGNLNIVLKRENNSFVVIIYENTGKWLDISEIIFHKWFLRGRIKDVTFQDIQYTCLRSVTGPGSFKLNLECKTNQFLKYMRPCPYIQPKCRRFPDTVFTCFVGKNIGSEQETSSNNFTSEKYSFIYLTKVFGAFTLPFMCNLLLIFLSINIKFYVLS